MTDTRVFKVITHYPAGTFGAGDYSDARSYTAESAEDAALAFADDVGSDSRWDGAYKVEVQDELQRVEIFEIDADWDPTYHAKRIDVLGHPRGPGRSQP